jgi:hypothetical protein
VINRLKDFSCVPSWVWVGIGRMPVEKTLFPLAAVNKRFGVWFVHGKANTITSSSLPAPGSTSRAGRGWGGRRATRSARAWT